MQVYHDILHDVAMFHHVDFTLNFASEALIITDIKLQTLPQSEGALTYYDGHVATTSSESKNIRLQMHTHMSGLSLINLC